MTLLVLAFFLLSALNSYDAFCLRRYDFPYWTPKNLSQRAADSDIVVFGTIIDSPCEKPTIIQQPVNLPTAAPVNLNATNSSSGAEQAATTPRTSVQQTNITDICAGYQAFYNVTMEVYCVIKGGSVPKVLHLNQFGFGPEMCVNYALNETFHAFHGYKGLNYLVFLGRDKGSIDSRGFWLHKNNIQLAATEISDVSMLNDVFKTAGGHAHRPTGALANETISICKPYVGGSEAVHVTSLLALLVLFTGYLLV